LIKTIYMLLRTAEHPFRIFDGRLPQNLILECLHSLPLPNFCMTTSECSYGWGAVSVFSSTLNVGCVYQLTPTL